MAKESEKARVGPKGQLLRKPYVKPGFRFERVFETMALSCGKTAGQQGQCHLVTKRS